jgi:hypothetical protein
MMTETFKAEKKWSVTDVTFGYLPLYQNYLLEHFQGRLLIGMSIKSSFHLWIMFFFLLLTTIHHNMQFHILSLLQIFILNKGTNNSFEKGNFF